VHHHLVHILFINKLALDPKITDMPQCALCTKLKVHMDLIVIFCPLKKIKGDPTKTCLRN